MTNLWTWLTSTALPHRLHVKHCLLLRVCANVLLTFNTILAYLVYWSKSAHLHGHFCIFKGPLVDTVEDFWRMAWEQNAPIIVMLTKLEERDKVMCISTHVVYTSTTLAWHQHFLVQTLAELASQGFLKTLQKIFIYMISFVASFCVLFRSSAIATGLKRASWRNTA